MLIFLVGYMACGKSTIGRKLSKRLKNYELLDTDAEIEQREGRKVADIFAQDGETAFRAMERCVLDEIIREGGNKIISTGGGLPLFGDNMQRMNEAGRSIYIRRTAENIASRLSAQGREKRPKLRGLNDDELVAFMSAGIEERDPTYKHSQLVIEAVPYRDSEILDKIVEFLNL